MGSETLESWIFQGLKLLDKTWTKKLKPVEAFFKSFSSFNKLLNSKDMTNPGIQAVKWVKNQPQKTTWNGFEWSGLFLCEAALQWELECGHR
jgi:hypothetical protein